MCELWKHGCPYEPPEPPQLTILTRWDDEFERYAIAFEQFALGNVPEEILKAQLLVLIKMDCYQEGVRDQQEGRVRYGPKNTGQLG